MHGNGRGPVEKSSLFGVGADYGCVSSLIIYSWLGGTSVFLVVSFVVTSPLPLVEVNVDSEEKNRLKTRNIIGMTGLILY